MQKSNNWRSRAKGAKRKELNQICGKCGKLSWAPQIKRVKGKNDQIYTYLYFRHLDHRKTYGFRGCYVKEEDGN